MKKLLFIVLLLFSIEGISQRKYMYGVVKDSATKEEMIGTHIQNLTSGSLTFADEYGKFKMPAQVGDTLMLSNVGFQTLGWVAEESWFVDERIEFFLPVDTIFLKEVVIGEFPEYTRFKQLIVDTEVEDTSFWYHGVQEPVMEEHNVLEKKQFTNPLFMATHPISFFHYAFNKKEKEKRKVQQLNKNKHMVAEARLKFTREWVGEMTRLEGDQLTDFIAYCKFTPKYLSETRLYVIHEKMMALLDEFLADQAKG